MGVSVAASSAVHVQDARVQRLLVVQRKGHGVQTTSPILPTRLGNGLEQNPSSSHVLILQELLGLLPFLFGALQEKSGEMWQGNIIPVEVHAQRQVGVGSSELEVDQFVEVPLSLRMEVLSHHRLHFLVSSLALWSPVHFTKGLALLFASLYAPRRLAASLNDHLRRSRCVINSTTSLEWVGSSTASAEMTSPLASIT